MIVDLELPPIDEVGVAIGIDVKDWRWRCHEVSLAVVKGGFVDGGRVARGTAKGIGVHSWIMVGDDPYSEETPIVDPTFWSMSEYWSKPGSDWFVGSIADGLHTPQGSGNIWVYGKPVPGDGPVVSIPTVGLSGDARLFLELLGPLDRRGWVRLASGPMEGWPSAEIIDAMCNVDELAVLIPIDIVGMLTMRNPGGLYW